MDSAAQDRLVAEWELLHEALEAYTAFSDIIEQAAHDRPEDYERLQEALSRV